MSYRTKFKSLLLVVVILVAAGYGSQVARAVPLHEDKVLADIGFRPAKDGFKFQNYTNESVQNNMTAAEMKRMFGEGVCADKNDPCTLTPPAQQYMDEANKIMNGGHCEGMAVLSLVLYAQKEKASQFGGNATPDLALENADLQKEIAYWFTTQMTSPVTETKVFDKTPAELVDYIVNAMKDGEKSADFLSIGFFKREYKEGHAVTPYAVVDKGNDTVWIMVYDNNFPGEERHIEINTKANTWQYSAAASPDIPESLYEGDAASKTIAVTPTQPRLGQQACPFCQAQAAGHGLARMDTASYNMISLTSGNPKEQASLLITDASGHKIGYEGGKFVNDFPGAKFQALASGDLWSDSPEPVYFIPTGVAFTIVLDGSDVKTEDPSTVSMIGPGYDLAVEDIKVEPKQQDTITFSADGKHISYKTAGTESPTLVLGVENKGADYEFEIVGAKMDGGGTFDAEVNGDKGQVSLKTADSKGPSTYALHITRIDDKGSEEFTHDGLTLDSGDTAYLDYGTWAGNGKPMNIQIDKGSTGKLSDATPVDDSK